MKILKKLIIATIIICLFFSFSLLVGFSNSKAEKTLNEISDENILMDDGKEDGNGEEGSGKGLNIEDLINLVQEATEKHLAILQEVLERAPEAAKGVLQRAIDVSTRGSIRAIEALSKIKPSNKDNDNNGLKKFHIIASCNRGGTIFPKGIQFIEGGSSTFEITSDPGYALLWVRVDNEKKEGITSYTFDDIDRNHTIHAHFKKIRE
ncbi:MAG: hypothetical protein E3J83_02465 [Candidatus Atribacteria bacterium]|nr:MAG: hypothetical protein E3J83_02465 [Candidatus Atribacteria bacterium]